MKAPKRFECTECGFISDKCNKVKFPTMTFATCFKCHGRLIENPKWLDWLKVERLRGA